MAWSHLKGIHDLGRGAWTLAQRLFSTIIKPSAQKIAAFILSAIKKLWPHIRQAIFEGIKDVGCGVWTLVKWLVKAFLSKVLPTILIIVLIRLALPYFIPFIGYMFTWFFRWLFRPFHTFPDKISRPIQALGDWARTLDHRVAWIRDGIAHGVSIVNHNLGDGVHALRHGAVWIRREIAHEISPAVHEVSRVVFGFLEKG